MTDTMGRMHSDAQFAGSSSVPAHVEMMGLPRNLIANAFMSGIQFFEMFVKFFT